MIRNLTGHAIHIWNREETRVMVTIPPDPLITRSRQATEIIGHIPYQRELIPMTKNTYNGVPNLPDKVPGTWLVVSKIIAMQYPERDDLLIVNGVIRDRGTTIGCRSLARI